MYKKFHCSLIASYKPPSRRWNFRFLSVPDRIMVTRWDFLDQTCVSDIQNKDMNSSRVRQNHLTVYCLTHYYVKKVSLLPDSDLQTPKPTAKILNSHQSHQLASPVAMVTRHLGSWNYVNKNRMAHNFVKGETQKKETCLKLYFIVFYPY